MPLCSARIIWEAPLIDRLLLKTRKAANGCILWQGSKNSKGYGNIQIGRPAEGTVLSHRASYELFVGPIPEGLCVLHDCPGGDNPACINPMHLWLGTKGDNNTDMARKKRVSHGESHYMATLPDADIPLVLAALASGKPQSQVAVEFNVSQSTVSRIAHGKTRQRRQ